MSAEEEEAVVNMDKKNANRQSSGPPEAKKSDASFSKNGKFGGRRREPSSPRPKNDFGNNRRPTPQKTGGTDKRPRTRNTGPGRKREQVTQERAEVGSAIRQGNKKTNLNHLLNFTYEPRGHGTSGGDGRASSNWRRRNFWSGRNSTRFNKEQFLQANCQFVVQEGRDYKVHAADPDTLVDWDLIEQVRITSHEVPSCPICLYPPTAAKITRCGHIYCWACMLHYLSLGEKPWRKCPICYDAVEPKDLKSVVALETHAYSAGESIRLKLMRRERGFTYALPVAQWRNNKGEPHNIEDDVDTCYAKLLVATSEQVQRIVDAEFAALDKAREEEGETLEGSFTKAALEQLNCRAELLQRMRSIEEQMVGMDVSSGESSDDHPVSPTTPPPPTISDKSKKVVYLSAFSDEEEEAKETEENEPEKSDVSEKEIDQRTKETVEEVAPERDGMASGDSDKIQAGEKEDDQALLDKGDGPAKRRHPNRITTEYYYYQADDGQHIYLNSLNARCLLHTYGNWENCPETISANIIERTGYSMNQDTRSRLRYLSHLPLTCEFQVVELDLNPPIVSEESLQVFKMDIEKRKRDRRRKERDDKRIMKKMEADERKRMGIGPGLKVSLDNASHFPCYRSDLSSETQANDTAHENIPPSSNASSEYNTPILSPVGSPGGLNPNASVFLPGADYVYDSIATKEEDQKSSGMSFAQMLQSGKAKSMDVWGKVACPAPRTLPHVDTSAYRRPRTASEGSDEVDPADYVPVPTFKTSFGDAIAEALNKHAWGNDNPEVVMEAKMGDTPPEAKGKKKKKVKKLLFTTSMARTK